MSALELIQMSRRIEELEKALEHIAKYEPTKGMVKMMPLRAIEEINKIAREALSGSGEKE